MEGCGHEPGSPQIPQSPQKWERRGESLLWNLQMERSPVTL